MQRATALDRRRQAQIANQIGTINRLLEGDHGYSEEMRILHEAGAALVAENQELREALGNLVQALSPEGAATHRPGSIADALEAARQHVAVSEPVSASTGDPGQ